MFPTRRSSDLFNFNGTAIVAKVSAANGDWNTASTWMPNGVPASSERVIIKRIHRVTASVGVTRNAITDVYGTFAILNNTALPTGTSNFNYVGDFSRLETRFTENTQVNIPNTAIYWPVTNGPRNVDHNCGFYAC